MSKYIFTLLLDGPKQVIPSSEATATWNGLTSFVEYNRAGGGTLTIPLKDPKGIRWQYGTIIKVAATAATQTGGINISVNGSNIRTLDSVGEQTTLVYTIDQTWVPIADDSSTGTISTADFTATGTITTPRLTLSSPDSLTQTTNRANAVTATKFCGTIVTDSASLAASTAAEFTVNLTGVTATSKVFLTAAGANAASFTGLAVKSVAANSFVIVYQNASASAANTNTLTINYLVV